MAVGANPAGNPVCIAPQEQLNQVVAADGLGGAYFCWTDTRQVYYGYSAGVQHLDATGQRVAGWPADGLLLTPGPTVDNTPAIASDGMGGLFLVWNDVRNAHDFDLYMQHLTSLGAPAPGWPAGGLAIAAGPGSQGTYIPPLSDGSGGALVVWADGRPGAPGDYVEHVLADGTPAPEAVAGGTLVATGRGLAWAVSDGAGGCYLSLALGSRTYAGQDSTYYLLHVNSAGTVLPGWTPNGTLVCTADVGRNGLRLAADAAGRAYLAWNDYRGHGAGRIYATQWQPDGTRAPGWQANGNTVTTLPGTQYLDDVLADGFGGVWLAGEFNYNSTDNGFIQHLGAMAAPASGWNSDGQALSARSSQYNECLASDGAGGAFVAWDAYGLGVYANHYAGDFATAAQLALVSADAAADRVTLLWQGDAASRAAATVERRTVADGWQAVGTPVLDSGVRLRFEDRDVVAGGRYAYRLRVATDGGSWTTAESWVDVPAVARLALAGLTPNPATSTNLRVSFSLPNAAPARLELIDVSGRRIAAREVGTLGAGTHVESLQSEARVPAGLYWLRLTQAGQSLTARAVIAG